MPSTGDRRRDDTVTVTSAPAGIGPLTASVASSSSSGATTTFWLTSRRVVGAAPARWSPMGSTTTDANAATTTATNAARGAPQRRTPRTGRRPRTGVTVPSSSSAPAARS